MAATGIILSSLAAFVATLTHAVTGEPSVAQMLYTYFAVAVTVFGTLLFWLSPTAPQESTVSA
ncbi:hypothetical protein [Oceaniglobus trochenteri]|uniref:hypothetical protein n=1 Tax=Oceaniglobus trochenteri TaxID=2763260 RepID=UPI001CFFF4B6|nr:hypothetical protein [Oceaniglobus trochenteri]